MSNRQRPRTEPTRGEWLRCDDCDSTVHENVWHGAVMCVEVEHSPTCPAWREDGREVAVAFLPKAEGTKP